MSDPGAIPLGLAQQEVARHIDPEQLEMMGKKAAALYSSGNPLSEAVVEVVKEARLSPEQVKRVCEFANTSAYLSAFEKAGAVRNITFVGGPADPGRVLKDLNDGSSPAIHQVDSGDYTPPSGSYKTASGDNSLLAEAFGVGMEKTAGVRDHSSRENPVEEINDLRITLEGAREQLMSKLSSSEILLADIKSVLQEKVAEAVLEGMPMGDILRAWSSYGNAQNIKEATALIRDHLRERKILGQDQFVDSLTKVASPGIIPNPSHPVVDHFLILTKVAFEHKKLEEGIRLLDTQLGGVHEAFRGML
jgi:hypothetical protein